MLAKIILSADEILAGYDAVAQIYPFMPTMCTWRAWEYAAYRHYRLHEPVLDVGCGDGEFFRLLWPEIRDVIGIDSDRDVADAAQRSGVYRDVQLAPAHHLPTSPESFASAFANCSLEHMDYLPEVLQNIRRSLRPDGEFLISVVTDKFLEWNALSLLFNHLGEPERARTLQSDYESYHHLVNPLPVDVWVSSLEDAGFEILEHIPVVSEFTTRLFLFSDHLWHVKNPRGELGDILYPYLRTIPDFPYAFRKIFSGFLQMERDWTTGSGAIFWMRRRG